MEITLSKEEETALKLERGKQETVKKVQETINKLLTENSLSIIVNPNSPIGKPTVILAAQ